MMGDMRSKRFPAELLPTKLRLIRVGHCWYGLCDNIFCDVRSTLDDDTPSRSCSSGEGTFILTALAR